MRAYSVRERVGFGVLAVFFLAAAIVVTMLLVTRAETRSVGTWAAAIGAWGGVALFVKIALTGTSWGFFELPVSSPFSTVKKRMEKKRSEGEDGLT